MENKLAKEESIFKFQVKRIAYGGGYDFAEYEPKQK